MTITRPPQLAVTRFLAFGDSITWGTDRPPEALFFYAAYPEPPPITSYPSQLNMLLTTRYVDQTITVVNEGWPGEWIATGLKRLPGVVTQHDPEVLLLLDGANDLLGNPSSATAQYIATKLGEMIRAARQRKPSLKVMLANFPPQFEGTGTPDRNRGVGAPFVPELNAQIASLAARENATLVDLYAALLPGLKQNISRDGLHPTVQGYALMAQVFHDAVVRTHEVKKAFR